MRHLLPALFIFGTACGAPAPSTNAVDNRPVVAVTILPQADIVGRIAADRVDVVVVMDRGGNDETYELRPRQMAELARASVFFSVGAPAERNWIDRLRATTPSLKFVATDASIEKIPSIDDHDGGERDPHIWLSPRLVARQAEIVAGTLEAIDPRGAAVYAANLAVLRSELDAFDREIASSLADSAIPRAFIALHPAWGYFARDYGLEQIAVEVEGKDPKPAQLEALIKRARRLGVRVIVTEPGMSDRAGEELAAATGARILVLEPTARDWRGAIRRLAAAIAAPR